MTLEQLIETQFRKLGAVRAEVTRNGIASHWQSPREAFVAKGKLIEMGLKDVEIFFDGGCFAVFGRFGIESVRSGMPHRSCWESGETPDLLKDWESGGTPDLL